jgi:hypothetical protein
MITGTAVIFYKEAFHLSVKRNKKILCNFYTFSAVYPKIHKKMSFHAVSIHFPPQVLYNSNVIYQ